MFWAGSVNQVIRFLKWNCCNTTADLGFKHYTLQDVSQNTLDKIEKFEDSKFITDDTIYNVFGVDTVLTTWLVHDGYGFSNHMECNGIVNL